MEDKAADAGDIKPFFIYSFLTTHRANRSSKKRLFALMLPLILCLVIGVASGLLTVDYHVDFRKGSFPTTSVEKVRSEKMGCAALGEARPLRRLATEPPQDDITPVSSFARAGSLCGGWRRFARMLPKITRILVTTMVAKARAGKKSNWLPRTLRT